MICTLKSDNFSNISGGLVHNNQGWIDGDLMLNVEYNVFAIGIHEGSIKILVDPADNCRPVWYSISDFDIIDNNFPFKPSISVDTNSSDWTIIIGYSSLVNSEEHFNGILERNEQEIAHFRKFKQSILK